MTNRSLLVPMVSHQIGLRGLAKRGVLPVELNPNVDAMSDVAGSLTIARAGGEMGKLFEEFCRRHLCMESWNFIVDVCKYEASVRTYQLMLRCWFVCSITVLLQPRTYQDLSVCGRLYQSPLRHGADHEAVAIHR